MTHMNNGWEEDDYEDVLPPLEDEEEDERPLFGCACQDPLTVDTVCDGCIAYLQEQDAEVERERIAKACAFTVEECVYWAMVAAASADAMVDFARIGRFAAGRNVEALRRVSLVNITDARHAASLDWWSRQNLVAWALCREAIRAIERERSGRR